MNQLYYAPPIFFVIAFVFSMLGMGGSQLYVPILYWLGMDFKTEAIPLGMLLNLVNSGSAAVIYGRQKLIDWNLAVPFGISMIVLAPVGTWMNVKLPTKPVILIFAVFTAMAGVLMLSGWRPKKGSLDVGQRVILGIIAGSILGFFAGLIGRGGGSFVVPLLFIAGLDAKIAAATSALSVSGSGLSSFISHLATAAQPQWGVWTASAVSVFIGSQTGSRVMSKHLKGKSIKYIFGLVLLAIALMLIIKDVL